MMMFGQPQPEREEDKWKGQLARFAKENQEELAALSWGLFLERGESDETLGIDLQPTPHFVFCPKSAIEKLNQNVDGYLQEILGIVDNHQPDLDVLIIGIGKEQIKVIQFESQPSPSVCFQKVGKDVDTLLDMLESRLQEKVRLMPKLG